MEHKLIMENWRKAVKEASLTTKVIDVASGSVDGININDIDDIVSILVKNLAEAFGLASRSLVKSGIAGKVDAASGQAPRVFRRIYAEMNSAGLLSKLQILFKEKQGASYLISKIRNVALTKGLAKILPPLAIALEIKDIIDLWNRETKGTNVWSLAADAISGNHAYAKDASKEKYNKIVKSEENFDAWEEDEQIGWCLRTGNAPKNYKGRLKCSTVLDKAEPEEVARIKKIIDKREPAGMTDQQVAMSVPAS